MIDTATLNAIAAMLRRNGHTLGATRYLRALVAFERRPNATTRRELFRARRFFVGA